MAELADGRYVLVAVTQGRPTATCGARRRHARQSLQQQLAQMRAARSTRRRSSQALRKQYTVDVAEDQPLTARLDGSKKKARRCRAFFVALGEPRTRSVASMPVMPRML